MSCGCAKCSHASSKMTKASSKKKVKVKKKGY